MKVRRIAASRGPSSFELDIFLDKTYLVNVLSPTDQMNISKDLHRMLTVLLALVTVLFAPVTVLGLLLDLVVNLGP